MLDCAIIGGGPAGLNAALVLGRARRSAVLFDNNQPRNAVTQESHGFITRDGVTPKEFRSFAHQDIYKYPTIEIKQCKIVKIERESNSAFKLTTHEGVIYFSRKIILATGLKERLPHVEGILEFYGKSIFYCPYCDGWELRDQPLILISENSHVSHMAKILFQWTNDLVVCTNGKKIISQTDEELLNRKGILIYDERIIKLSGSEGKLQKVILEDGKELSRTGGFVTVDLEQSNDLVYLLGCKLSEHGGIIIDSLGRTNIEDVYAAGDLTLAAPTQLIIAASEGTRAAMGVNYDLTMEEFR